MVPQKPEVQEQATEVAVAEVAVASEREAEPGHEPSGGLFVPGEGPGPWPGAACKAETAQDPGRLRHHLGTSQTTGKPWAEDPGCLLDDAEIGLGQREKFVPAQAVPT